MWKSRQIPNSNDHPSLKIHRWVILPLNGLNLSVRWGIVSARYSFFYDYIFRLCFYPHTIILAQRRAEPTNVGCPVSGFPPFKMEHFVELSVRQSCFPLIILCLFSDISSHFMASTRNISCWRLAAAHLSEPASYGRVASRKRLVQTNSVNSFE